jgi:SAM-dependent methyltransferase
MIHPKSTTSAKMIDKNLPKLYTELADWWAILSSPEDYAEEAQFYRQVLVSTCNFHPRTMLELGSGGGNNASHLKKHFEITCIDLSPRMLAVSQKLNPECEHFQGDMRDIRLGRTFDTVFIHDAIDYMTAESDLRMALETAYIHSGQGGVALFAPDYTRETFKPSTSHGGHDAGDRGLRYLDWTWDPKPEDTVYMSTMVYLLREGSETVRSVLDKHEFGLFSHDDWLRLISDVGFQAQSMPFNHSDVDYTMFVFLGLKP